MKNLHLHILAFLMALSAHAQTPPPSPKPSPSVPPAVVTADAKEQLNQLIEDRYKRYDTGTKAYASAYNTCAAGAVILAALAALLAKLGVPTDQKTRDNIVATAAALAALFTTLNATLKFNQKWIANRVSRAATYDLKIQLSATSPNLDEIQKKFSQIVLKHEDMITK